MTNDQRMTANGQCSLRDLAIVGEADLHKRELLGAASIRVNPCSPVISFSAVRSRGSSDLETPEQLLVSQNRVDERAVYDFNRVFRRTWLICRIRSAEALGIATTTSSSFPS